MTATKVSKYQQNSTILFLFVHSRACLDRQNVENFMTANWATKNYTTEQHVLVN